MTRNRRENNTQDTRPLTTEPETPINTSEEDKALLKALFFEILQEKESELKKNLGLGLAQIAVAAGLYWFGTSSVIGLSAATGLASIGIYQSCKALSLYAPGSRLAVQNYMNKYPDRLNPRLIGICQTISKEEAFKLMNEVVEETNSARRRLKVVAAEPIAERQIAEVVAAEPTTVEVVYAERINRANQPNTTTNATVSEAISRISRARS